MIGTTLDGKYVIQKLLGAGAMGQVYLAAHAATARRVAVKVISSPDIVNDPTVVARFQLEARVAGAIDTQHIAQVLDAGLDRASGLPFLVMEFLTGEDLQHLLKRLGPQPIAPELALRIVAQACLGLQKAHEAGVVHRDIKPANLYLAKRDAGELLVKLLDFGIAKVMMDRAHDTESAGLTRTGSLLGSPLYVSPEQARGDVRRIDHRTDIWSMGVVLHQALSAHTPYGHIKALGELILAICTELPRPIQDSAPWVPPQVAVIVHRCLRHDPAERYQSAMELFHAIHALLPPGWSLHEEMLVPLHDLQRSQVAAKLVLPTADTQANHAVTRPPASRPMSSAGKAALGLSAAALLSVAAGVTYRAARPRAQPTQALPPAPIETPAPPPLLVVTASATAAEPDKWMRRVKVVVLPADARVEVDGAPAQLQDGQLEIAGTLGSKHCVRVRKGNFDMTKDVIITQDGAEPSKLELVLVFGGSKAVPAPTSPATATTSKGIDRDFGE